MLIKSNKKESQITECVALWRKSNLRHGWHTFLFARKKENVNGKKEQNERYASKGAHDQIRNSNDYIYGITGGL